MPKTVRAKSETVTNYWFAFYVVDDHCTLCGNYGWLDTRSQTAAGVNVGSRVFCICPNGQAMRHAKRDISQAKKTVYR